MQELIYKQDAHDKLEYMYLLIERDRGQGNEVAKGLRMACKAIGDIEAVDAEMPCSVRHGRWIEVAKHRDENGTILTDYECSECCAMVKDSDAEEIESERFCYNCGTKMRATDTNVGGKGGDDNG